MQILLYLYYYWVFSSLFVFVYKVQMELRKTPVNRKELILAGPISALLGWLAFVLILKDWCNLLIFKYRMYRINR